MVKDVDIEENNGQLPYFSHAAFLALKDVVFSTEHGMMWLDMFATSTISFQAWMSPASFLYFCLTTQRCPNRTRIFFYKDKKENIKDDKERKWARTILQAHELFGCHKFFCTDLQIQSWLSLSANDSQTYYPKKDIDFNKLLSVEEAKYLLNNDKKTLDFCLLQSGIRKMLIFSCPKKGATDGECTVKVIVPTLYLEEIYNGYLKPEHKDIEIKMDIEAITFYGHLKEFIEKCTENNEDCKVASENFFN